MLERLGRLLAKYLSKPAGRGVPAATSKPGLLAATLRKGDVLLVEGDSRLSTAIKYVTQSSWSHAAFFVGGALGPPASGADARVLVEADVNEGVRSMPLARYQNYHTRICRPVGLSPTEIDAVVDFVVSRIGLQYDLRHVLDLARYLIQRPPVPNRWRRRLLALGSGDPTRAICSSLIAQAFQSIRYPILPDTVVEHSIDPRGASFYREILHIRHHSLFAPRDFDVSPYFQIVKPTIEQGFDFHRLTWSTPPARFGPYES